MLRILLVLAGCLLGPQRPAAAGVELGIRQTQFTLDDRPAFLLGISYYAGSGASDETLAADLGEMQRCGFNWIRVWATWRAFDNDISAIDGEGRPRPAYLNRLEKLLRECDRRGMAVDVTLSRGNGAAGSPRLHTLAAHLQAVETLVTTLKAYRNWYLDLGNERNIRDARFVPWDDLSRLAKRARDLDPQRLLTASHAGDLTREEMHSYLDTVKVDFLAIHRPRYEHSPGQTEERTRELIRWMKEEGRIVPVHFQEPFRRGYADWNPKAEDFIEDARGAKQGGAAGWCLHNGGTRKAKDGRPRRSFDLCEGALFHQLDAVEIRVVHELSGCLRAGNERPGDSEKP